MSLAVGLVVWTCSASAQSTPTPAPRGPSPTATTAPAESRQSLLDTARFPGNQWVFYPGKRDARIEQTWVLEPSPDGPILICRGEPHGYLRTAAAYQDFDFGLEWKYPRDENGNSGILVFTSGDDRIWPMAVQVQLHQPRMGSVFGSGGARVDQDIKAAVKVRPVNHWNELLIRSRQGVLSVAINGRDVGAVRVLSPSAGSIGFQSEGSEIHFRHVWIRPVARPDPASQLPMVWCPPACVPFAPSVQPPMAYYCLPGWPAYDLAAPRDKGRRNAREPDDVAHGNPMADGSNVLRSGRGVRMPGNQSPELEAPPGRGSMRNHRNSRGRR